MHVIYCQKMIFPNFMAHALHTGILAANFAAAGAPTTFFPGLPFSGGGQCMRDFFSALGLWPLPERLELDGIPTRNKGLYGLGFRYKLLRAMRKYAPAVCFASSVKEAVMALQLRELSGKRGDIRVVFEIHHAISRLKSGQEAEKLLSLEEKAFRQADLIVFNSAQLEEQCGEYLPRPQAALVSPLGYNADAIRPARPPEAPEPGQQDGRLRLAYVGTLQPGKGVDNLLRALALLPEDYRLDIIGGASDGNMEAIRTIVAEKKLADRVAFAGRLQQGDIGAHLKDTDIFVIPLETDKDFLAPMKMYEALGFAVPIVATPMPSVAHILKDGVNALFSRGTDPESLAGALLSLGENPALRQSMRHNNQALATAFTAAARAKTLLGTFSELF